MGWREDLAVTRVGDTDSVATSDIQEDDTLDWRSALTVTSDRDETEESYESDFGVNVAMDTFQDDPVEPEEEEPQEPQYDVPGFDMDMGFQEYDPDWDKDQKFTDKNVIDRVGGALTKGAVAGYGAASSGLGVLLKTMGQGMDERSPLRNVLMNTGENMRTYWQDVAKDQGISEYDINPLDNMGMTWDPAFWIYHLSRQAPMVVGGIAGGGIAGGIVGGLQMGGATYNEMKDKGFSDSTAAKAGAVDFALGTVLEKVGLASILKPYGKVLVRTAKGAVTEGATEMSQELTSSMQKRIWEGLEKGKSADDITMDILDKFGDDMYGALGAGVVGMGTGGPMAGVTGSRYSEQDIEDMKAEAVRKTLDEQMERMQRYIKADAENDLGNAIKFINDQESLETPLSPFMLGEEGPDFNDPALTRHLQGSRVVDQPQPGGPTDTAHLVSKEQQPGEVPENVKFQIALQDNKDNAMDDLTKGITPDKVMMKMAILADQKREEKSAKESAEVFESAEPDYIETLVGVFEMKDAKDKKIAEELAKPKSAKESAEVFQTEPVPYTTAILEELERTGKDKKVATGEKLAMKGHAQVNMPELSGKSAQATVESIEANRKAGLDAIDSARQELQKGNFQGAVDALTQGSQKDAQASAQAIMDPKTPKVRKLLGSQETVSVLDDTDPNEVKPQRPVYQTAKDYGFTEDNQAVPVAQDPADILEAEQEGEAETEGEVIQTNEGIDVPVSDRVKTKAGQQLVQAIINGEPTQISEALDNFRVADRKKAYTQATKDAILVAGKSGAGYDLGVVEFNAEANSDLVKYAKKKEGGIQWDKEATGVYTGSDSKGNSYSIFKINNKEYILRKGNEEVGRFPSLKKAKDAVVDVVPPKHTVHKEGTGRNTWVVRDADGNLVDPKKPGGGDGFKNKSDATRFIQEMEGTEVDSLVQKGDFKAEAEAYAKNELDKLEDKGAKKAPIKPKVVRRKKTKGKLPVKEKLALQPDLDEKSVGDIVEDLNPETGTEEISNRDPKIKGKTKGLKHREAIKQYGSKRIKAAYSIIESLVGEENLENVPLRVIDSRPPIGKSSGTYHADTGEIVIYTEQPDGSYRSMDSYVTTLVHELVHAVTYKKLQNNSKIAKELDDLRGVLAEKLLDDFEKSVYYEFAGPGGAKKYNQLSEGDRAARGIYGNDRARLIYALLDSAELLSNATHPDIQVALEDAPATLRTKVMSKIKEIMGKLFGFSSKEANAYEQVMSAIGRLQDTDSSGNFDQELNDFTESMSENTMTQEKLAELAEKADQRRKDQDTYSNTKSQKIAEAIKNSIIPINERLEGISKRLSYMMRSAEAKAVMRNGEMSKKLTQFENVSKATFKIWGPKDQFIWEQALFNGDADVINAFFSRGSEGKRLKRAYDEVSIVKDQLRDDLIAIGMLDEKDLVENYWPRDVKDLEGLIKHMANDPEYSFLDKEVEESAPALIQMGIVKNKEEARKYILTKVMKTGQYPSVMRVVKGTKQRKMPKVKAEYMQYYRNPIESMGNHIEESNDVIAMRRMLGDTNIKQARKDLYKVNRAFDKAETKEERDALRVKAYRLAQSIDQAEYNAEVSIGSFVAGLRQEGLISKEQEQEAVNLIRARITQTGITNAFLRGIRDVGLAGTLGGVTNTLTQLKDATWILYRHGTSPITMAKAMMKTVTGASDIKGSDLDLQRVFSQFRSKSEGAALQKIFKVTGFTTMDNMMKVANMQATIDKAFKTASTAKGRKALKEKYELAWGKELTESLIQDLQDGTVTDDVKTFAITELSRDVPIFLSEMPVYYMNGNARFFYTLKSYAIKAMNNTYRDGLKKMIHGKGMERLTGAKNLAAILILHAIVGGGVEELKDLIKGQRTNFWDNAGDEILGLMMLNRYSLDKMKEKGPGEALRAGILDFPAVDMASALWTDVTSLFGEKATYKSLKYIPFIKESYYWTEEGRTKEQDTRRKRIFATMKDEVQSSRRVSNSTRKEIREYNKGAKKGGYKPITYETIKRNRSRYIKELRGQKGSAVTAPIRNIGKLLGEVLGPASAIASPVPTDVLTKTKSFIDTVAIWENDKLLTKKNKDKLIFKNTPPESEKGKKKTWDIGFGHKITDEETKSGKIYGIPYAKGITLAQAKEILKKDFLKKEKSTKAFVNGGYKKHKKFLEKMEGVTIKWDDLDATAKLILTDYNFQGVLYKFPSFFKALTTKDYGSAYDEYIRKWRKDGKLVEDKKRNVVTKKMLGQLADAHRVTAKDKKRKV